jgi:pSer/pThr/pTyr-binding forkhead associated (FHA) protein
VSVARAFLRVISGPRQGLSVPLREDQPLLIGRTRGDVRIDDPLVSGAHCRVVHRNGHFVLQDLGSTNGTTVDGRRIQDVVLRPGSEIVLGSTKLLLFGAEEEGDDAGAADGGARDAVAWLLDTELQGEPRGPALEPALRLPAGLDVRVRVLAGPDKGRELAVQAGTAVIGRAQGEIPLSDPEVSRKHAVVEIFGRSMVFIRDDASTNGTYHNGRRVGLSRLRPGDTVGCGKTVMKVVT